MIVLLNVLVDFIIFKFLVFFIVLEGFLMLSRSLVEFLIVFLLRNVLGFFDMKLNVLDFLLFVNIEVFFYVVVVDFIID